jgi:AcrR family transcriptional regulator
MAKTSIYPQRDSSVSRHALVQAVGKTLAKKGFLGLGVNAVSREAGLDKVLIYRYFGGLDGLIRTYAREGDFWPSIEELAGGNLETYAALSLREKLRVLGESYLRGMRSRPLTLEIMAWEMVQRNELTEELEAVRENRFLRFSEMFFSEYPNRADLMAIFALIGAGIGHLVCRSRHSGMFNGIDLTEETGWKRIEQGLLGIVQGVSSLYAD